MPLSSSQWFWPIQQWPDAVETLAREAKLAPIMETANLPKLRQEEMPLNAQNIELVATYLGVESEPIQATYNDIDAILKFEGPMLLSVPNLALNAPELLLVLAAGAMAWGRLGNMPRLAGGIAIGCGILGLLAIVNVALVRALYAQLPDAAGTEHGDEGDS